jgi:thiamine phosphate synthase YjbQ (UPF0047 family)
LIVTILSELKRGNLFLKHISAGLTINEKTFFSDWIPEHYPKFEHCDEGLDDMLAHIKASIVGQSLPNFSYIHIDYHIAFIFT